MSEGDSIACKNTDRELWREREGDYYADSIHVTEHGGIGINCGGTVYVKPIREWHRLAGGKYEHKPDFILGKVFMPKELEPVLKDD